MAVQKTTIKGNRAAEVSPLIIAPIFSGRRASEIHSFIPKISVAPLQVPYYSEALPTTALMLCQSKQAEVLKATTSEGLAQGPYLAASVTFRMQGTDPTFICCPHQPQNQTI